MPIQRSRAWRRHQRARHVANRADTAPTQKKPAGHYSKVRPTPRYGKAWPAEKYWKHLYLRSEKLIRARQLGFPYPRRAEMVGELTVRL